MSTTVLRSFLVFVALLFLVDIAAACSCIGPRQRDGFHPSMSYWPAAAIFTGEVVEISFAPMGADGKRARYSETIFHFSVDKAFKGVEARTVELVGGGPCSYNFTQGRRYFVYAGRDTDGRLTEHLCGATVPLELAARDLAYAEEVRSGGVKGAWIVGAAVRYERRDVKDYGTRSPIPGVEVVLERVDQPGVPLLKTVTNSDGAYEFRDLSVGAYCVRAALPAGSRQWTTHGKPNDNCVWIDEQTRSESRSFVLTNTSSIRGRIVTPEGSPLPSQYLALIPVDENGKEISSSLSPSVNSARESGSYYFRDVAPGRYLLAVNPRNKPAKSDPAYPLMYYPGVLNRGAATILLVPESREMNLNDFALTRPLKVRWFSGTVLLADRSPAAGAKVILIDPNDRMMGTNVMEVTADDQGRFRLKGYESFPYWVDAYVITKLDAQPQEIPMWAPPVQLATTGSVDNIELVASLTYRSQPYH